jgi:hypothetical protein
MRRTRLILALGAAFAAASVQAAPGCAPPAGARDVEAAIRGWFAAFAREDYAAGYALQAPGFYAYDGGERYRGAELGELLKNAQAAGTRFEWNLHDMDVHLGCDQAWAAWVNTGAVGKPGAMQPVAWLESMVLRYAGGRWRIEFLHSDRVRPR